MFWFRAFPDVDNSSQALRYPFGQLRSGLMLRLHSRSASVTA